jgi:hypothetical protein
MAEHSTLTGSSLHEPKGAASATSGQVYVADGAGSGTWTQLKGYYVLHHQIEDISTAGDHYIPVPKAGTITNITTVLDDALSGSDLVIDVYDSAAASMGSITITQSGSASGDVDSLAPASNNTVTANDFIKLTVDGGPTTHVETGVAVLVEYDI